MFYFLHRLVKGIFMALVVAGLYWLWLQREAIEPVYVWYDVYENGGLKKSEQLSMIQGRIVRVVDGHTVQMHHDGKSYSVRLTGLQLPEPPLTNTEIDLEKKRRVALRDLALKQDARVDVTFSANSSLLGVVTVNGTNLNVLFITNGLSKFNPDYVKTVPRDVQYSFFAANRIRKKEIERQTALAMRHE